MPRPGPCVLACAALALFAASGARAQMVIPAPSSPKPTFRPSSSASSSSSSSSTGTGSISPTKRADPGLFGGNWYSTVELRHHLNTFYAPNGSYAYQEPSLHARLQVGAQFYDGLVDAYGTVGVFKMADSQQVLQRRPELALDLYPVRSRYFTLLQYNLVQFPVKGEDSGMTPEAPEDERVEYSDSTVTVLGLAPLAKLPLRLGSSKLVLKAGVDGWTKVYARKQYTQAYNQPTDTGDETDDGRLSLDQPAPQPTGTQPPIEDTALHYEDQAMMGFAFTPGFLHALTTEALVHYQSRFDPVYTMTAPGSVNHHYVVERYSYYQIRLHYDINDRVAVTNDFYHFHEGFFAGERKEAGWRFRNIARITCKL